MEEEIVGHGDADDREIADDTRYIETFVVESWAEHLRQHDRATLTDKRVQNAVIAFHRGLEPPRVSHLLIHEVNDLREVQPRETGNHVPK
jgi:hypothetical protein